jgi:hypothetical protein
MSKWNSWENDFLGLVFLNSAGSTVIGDGGGISGSSTAGNLYLALFTADPTETGSIANECTYTGYGRVAVARSAAGWTVSSGVCTNDAAITFGTCTAGSETASHFGICKAGTASVADLIMYGQFTGGGLSISSGVTPQIQASDLSITED